MFRLERRITRLALCLTATILLACGGFDPLNTTRATISPTVFERGERTTVVRVGDARRVTSANSELEAAFAPVESGSESQVVVPETVPVGPYEVLIEVPNANPSPVDIWVLSNEQPYFLDLDRTQVSLGESQIAVAVTVRPPGATTIEFELPAGVTATLIESGWRQVGAPFDIGAKRLATVNYKLNGELPPGDYDFKMLWKKGSTILAEDTGTIRVNEVENRLRVFNSQLNGPGNFFWEFPTSRIQRTIGSSSTTITIADANRSVTLSANKPLPPGQYFVPSDLSVTYRQGSNTYECAYGYVLIEENSSGILSFRMREMSMMASGTTPQGYFSMEGIVRRNF